MSDRITMTLAEWMAEGERLFGPDMMQWKFVCPACGHVQKTEDFRPYKARGATPDDSRFNCIGRFMDNPQKVFGLDSTGAKSGPCDYTTGGLFNITPVKVTDPDGKEYHSFAFAES